MRGRTPASHYPLPTINRKCTLLCDLCVTFALFALKLPSTHSQLAKRKGFRFSLGISTQMAQRAQRVWWNWRFSIYDLRLCATPMWRRRPRRRTLYGNIPPFRDAEAASPLLLRSSQPTTLNSQPTTHQSQIVNRSIVNSTNYPLPTTIYLSSLCDAHDRAFPKARGQFVARTDILRPTHDAPCAIHRKRIASLQRVRRIKQG